MKLKGHSDELTFEFDPIKNSKNKAKHGYTLKYAATIFLNELLEVYFDGENSDLDEDRHVAVGLTPWGEMFVVVFTENEDGSVIRVISGRRATKQEEKYFLKGRK